MGQIFGRFTVGAPPEMSGEERACTLDSAVSVVTDARLDARSELVAKLRGQPISSHTTDAELIARAYCEWGPACVQHLLGDYAFLLWDARTKIAFCARDHFGVKPLYYTQSANSLFVSNSMECLLSTPNVPRAWNELAVADTLLFGFVLDERATRWSAIQRLPPAHTLTFTDRDLVVRRYWTLPIDEPIRYARANEYVDHFLELFRAAIADRIISPRAAVLMSGGLDSTSVAAVAQQTVVARRAEVALRAFTQVFERVIADEEGDYARRVADSLDIPIHVTTMDQAQAQHARPSDSAPVGLPFRLAWAEQLRAISDFTPIVLTGYGGDPTFYPTQDYLTMLRGGLSIRELLGALGQYRQMNRRLPPLYLRSRLKRSLQKSSVTHSLPHWFNPEWAQRVQLEQRWNDFHDTSPNGHPLRPEAYTDLGSPIWSDLFERHAPSVLRQPLQVRHPFFDVRLVRYLLALPPLPWFENKFLLRQAMRGFLPETVRTRPKSPLRVDPLAMYLRQPNVPEIDALAHVPQLARFVNVVQLQRELQQPSALVFVRHVLELAEWLWRAQAIPRAAQSTANAV